MIPRPVQQKYYLVSPRWITDVKMLHQVNEEDEQNVLIGVDLGQGIMYATFGVQRGYQGKSVGHGRQ